MFRRLAVAFAAILLLGLVSLVPAQVVINEVLYDTISDDNPDQLFTELWGPAGFDVGGWTLVGINGNGGVEYGTVTIPDGTVIPQDGYLVLGNTAQVPNVDVVVGGGTGAGVDWQNAGSSNPDCDGLDLRNSDGETIDHICYGECAAGRVCTGEGSANAPDPYPQGGVNHSLARVPDHQDTNNNGADFVSLAPTTPGAPNAGNMCTPHNVTLGDIRMNDADGEPVLTDSFVVVRGVVNVDNFVFDDSLSSFYMQDDDAGVNIFGGSAPAGIAEGDCVVVSGWVSLYRGLTEIVSSGPCIANFRVEVVGETTPVAPQVTTTNAQMEPFEGMLVRINNVSIVDGTWPAQDQNASLTITDGNGTLILRIDRDTQIDGTPQPQGTFSVVGIITQFDDTSPYTEGYQITPRYISDLITTGVDDRPLADARNFRLVGAYPNPFNSVAQIRYEVGAAQDLTLRIYDLLGREVEQAELKSVSPGSHVYNWTPSGATGLYLVRLEGHSDVQTAKLLYLK